MADATGKLRLRWQDVDSLVSAVHSQKPVAGYTHNFYKYPGRFSPEFARSVVDVFSEPGELVLDPFLGGGTTLVEARVAGRLGLGSDISALASFVAKTKTRVLSGGDIEFLKNWFDRITEHLELSPKAVRVIVSRWPSTRNLHCTSTRPIRQSIDLALRRVARISAPHVQAFARCVVLKTGQWALDGRRIIPTATAFRGKLAENAQEMLAGASEYATAVRRADRLVPASGARRTICLNGAATDAVDYLLEKRRGPARVIVTSPPYPGIHMLYHRWQVRGGRETPAPFWIANVLDGAGAAYYCMQSRSVGGADKYFSGIGGAYSALSKVCSRRTTIVQLIAFAEPSADLPRYLSVMHQCGFKEYLLSEHLDSPDGRLWRNVPGRKWHANGKGRLSSAQEVVLIHRPF